MCSYHPSDPCDCGIFTYISPNNQRKYTIHGSYGSGIPFFPSESRQAGKNDGSVKGKRYFESKPESDLSAMDSRNGWTWHWNTYPQGDHGILR